MDPLELLIMRLVWPSGMFKIRCFLALCPWMTILNFERAMIVIVGLDRLLAVAWPAK